MASAPADGPEAGATDLSKAFQELARGEQTATALENRLSSVEQKLDQLLAAVIEEGNDFGQHRADAAPRADPARASTMAKATGPTSSTTGLAAAAAAAVDDASASEGDNEAGRNSTGSG